MHAPALRLPPCATRRSSRLHAHTHARTRNQYAVYVDERARRATRQGRGRQGHTDGRREDGPGRRQRYSESSMYGCESTDVRLWSTDADEKVYR
jgi:hypothetical protein